jgi:hypothetical protein
MKSLYVALWNNVTLVFTQLFEPANVKSWKVMLLVSLPAELPQFDKEEGRIPSLSPAYRHRVV